jgi:TRAP-type C4-dicarboxylate transport system permease small subunit
MPQLRVVLDWCTDAAMTVAEIAMALMMAHVVLQIVLRAVFQIPLDSVPEIVAFYYMAGMVFLAFAYVTREDGHIAASLFTDLLPKRVNDILQGIIFLVLAVAMAVFVWQTGGEALRMTAIGEFHQGANINLPKWPTRWFAPVGAGLMTLAALAMAADKFAHRGRATYDGPDDVTPAPETKG